MPPKRRRLSGEKQDRDEKHSVFMQWAKDRGVEVRGVQPERLPNRGLGLVTTKSVRKDEVLLFVPEKAMFKPDVGMLKREKLLRSSPQAQLTISAMFAFHRSKRSLQPWQSVWPTAEDFELSMPMCWPSAIHDLLPASVHQPLERQLADYRRDWAALSSLCTSRGFGEQDFRYYWMIVNSRSFHWKPPRGKAGSMVMCPFIDYMNHGPSGTSCHISQSDKGYEVVADRDYDAGEEILATYGAHPNDKLLVHYGFVCSQTPNGPSVDDDVRLDHLLLAHFSEQVRSQLQDVGFLGGYALIPATNEICFKTEVAVRAALLTCNEWEYFVSTGEDLSTDRSKDVKKFVQQVIQKYRQEIAASRKRAEQVENEIARSTLLTRYSQIEGAVAAYCEQ